MPCTGYFPPEHFGALGIGITDMASLSQAINAYFDRYAPLAIALKAQHAYQRTLHWEKRSDADAGRALAAVLKDPKGVDQASRLCLGDWCLARGVERAIAHNLPIKIHTGYYYNNNVMPMERIRPSLLCSLLIEYPAAKFVLMHAGYPYAHEIPALAKHFSNVYVDLCWAWAMDPLATMDVVRHYIHAAPTNKLFAFGGDTHTPTAAYGYLLQMRRWLGKALEAEIADGTLNERQAIVLTTSILRENQLACFDVAGRRTRLRGA
jgi:predicted TIM-barrel fold metal-dependent hydrolase